MQQKITFHDHMQLPDTLSPLEKKKKKKDNIKSGPRSLNIKIQTPLYIGRVSSCTMIYSK